MEWTILIGGVLAATYVFVRRDRHYPLEDRLPIIRHAIENGNDVQMTYFTYSNRKFTRRVITPLEVREQYGGRWYVYAHDHLRDDERTFKIERIKELTEVT